MTDWYCSSVGYTAVTKWAASATHGVGDIVRQLATPTIGNERCFRATAGTSGTPTVGSAQTTFSTAASKTITLTTTAAAVIVVAVALETIDGSAYATVSTVTASGLTFARRSQTQAHPTGNPFNTVEVWWAYSATTLASKVITVTASGTIDDASIVAFGVKNPVSTTAPWDANGSLPASSFSSAGPAAPVTISTTSTSTVMLEFFSTTSSGVGTTPSTGATIINTASNTGGTNWSNLVCASESSGIALASQSVAWGDSLPQCIFVVDAIAVTPPVLTSGASAPTWVLTKGGSTTDNTIKWIECTGDAAFQHQGTTSTWTAPHALITTACTWASSNGDRVFVSSDHAESQGTAGVDFSGGGQRLQIISVSRTSGNIPPLPADVTTGAVVTTTGSTAINFTGFNQYHSGITYNFGTGSTYGAPTFNQNLYLKNCVLNFVNTSTNNCFVPDSGATIILDNTNVSFGIAANGIKVGDCTFEWRGGSFTGWGSGTGGILFLADIGFVDPIVHGVDLTAVGANTICQMQGSVYARHRLYNCKLSASSTVTTTNANGMHYATVNLVNCDSGSTGYRSEHWGYCGSMLTDASIYRVGGSTDGVAPVSHSYNTNINPQSLSFDVTQFLDGFPISQWNTSTGSPKTATIFILSSATLTNADIWMELEYLGASGSPLSSFVSSIVATPLTTPSNYASDTSTWNGSTATTQKMTVTFTPQKVGLVTARIKVAKPSATIWIDPLLVIT